MKQENNLEIERKFLVKNLNIEISEFKNKNIEQVYIKEIKGMRVRCLKSPGLPNEYLLTIKSKGDKIRKELEMKISEINYLEFKKYNPSDIITKDRFYIPLENNLIAELDLYRNKLEGLLTVEVEFKTEKESNEFIPPSWFGKEVTYDKRYKNESLSSSGIPEIE